MDDLIRREDVLAALWLRMMKADEIDSDIFRDLRTANIISESLHQAEKDINEMPVANVMNAIDRQAAVEMVREIPATLDMEKGILMIDKAEVMTKLMLMMPAQLVYKREKNNNLRKEILIKAIEIVRGFVHECSGTTIYKHLPDGKVITADWGYVIEGLEQLHEWAKKWRIEK